MDAQDPVLQALMEQVRSATAMGSPLDIRGGGSKSFYGEARQGTPLEVRPLQGISSYEPSELVVTARAGTPLAELEATLQRQGQYLPFEPPHYAKGGTVGGMVASGLAGPARASAGSVRDYVLGVTLLNGSGQALSFGGQVIKNVAGYDVSRLMPGALGVLGVICEVSLKVMPLPAAQATLLFALGAQQALDWFDTWRRHPLPLTASSWHDGQLRVRLGGAEAAVAAALRRLGGERVEQQAAESWWRDLRDHRHDWFATESGTPGQALGGRLWRLSVPATSPHLATADNTWVEWHGAQRWWRTDASAATVRALAVKAGGHATLFRGEDPSAGVFAPLPPAIMDIHRRLKASFDPARIFNPGRLYPDL
jgi:FAD/FMN-containing dehydrogenase